MPEWTCSRRGDCCRQGSVVVMTQAERAAIERVMPSHTLTWLPHADARFVSLSAGPCPLLSETGLCSVYAVRPTNCRRYMCGRQDGEAWTAEDSTRSIPLRVIANRGLRRQYARGERKAQRWGRQMGWPE